MSALGTLIWGQWRIWRNGWRRDSLYRGQRVGMLIVMPLFMALLFGGTLYFLRHSGLLEMAQLGGLVPDAYESAARLSLEALAIASTATFIVVALSALEQAYETFFLAPDLPLLLSAPISRRAVFGHKFVANMRWDAAMILAMALPIWLAFGVWHQAPAFFYLVLIIAWGLLLILISGMGTFLAMLLARFIPTPRLRQFVISFTMTAGLLLVIGVQGLIIGLWRGEQIVDLLSIQWLSRQTWLPSVWLTRALEPLMHGDGTNAWRWLLLLAAGASLGLAASYTAAMRTYRDGWSQVQDAGQRKRRSGLATASRQSGASSPVWSMVAKDLRLFVRQPTQWYQAILATVVIIMVVVNVAGQRRGLPGAFMLTLIMSYVGASTFAMNLALRGVSKEGASWWLVQIAPVSDGQVYWSKFLAAFLPTAVYGSLALLGMQTALRIPVRVQLLSLPLLLIMTVGMIAAELAVGIWRTDLQRGAQTRNADLVAVLVSQWLGYLLIAPGLLALSLPPLLARIESPDPLRFMVIFALGTMVPGSLFYTWVGWHYATVSLRALRLSQEPASLRDLFRSRQTQPQSAAPRREAL